MTDWTVEQLLADHTQSFAVRMRPRKRWQKNPFLRYGSAVRTAQIAAVVERIYAIWRAEYDRKHRSTAPSAEEVAAAYLAGWGIRVQPRQVRRYWRDSSIRTRI
jgi:hypothetical protein